MKKKRLIISIISISLIVLVIGISSIIYINYNNALEEEKDEFREGFAIYIDDGSGNYSQYYGNSFTLDGYSIDLTNSSCVDGDNQTVEPSEVLSTSTNSKGQSILTVSTTTKLYCDIYLKKD